MKVYLITKECCYYDVLVKQEHKIFVYKENAESELLNQTDIHKKYHDASYKKIRELDKKGKVDFTKQILVKYNIEYKNDEHADECGFESHYHLNYIVENCWKFSIIEIELDCGELG